jgi:predicted lipoprotein with Yx(FWY)xxD motif
MRRLLAAVAILAALAFAACGDDDDENASSGAEAAAEETEAASAGSDQPKPDKEQKAPSAGTEVVAADSQYGSILFDADQQAIYLFDKESSDTSECYGDCAEAWPPVLTDGEPQAGSGIEQGLLDTTERDDGSTQVTYDGHPLYYYAHEEPGQVLCHNVSEFGGLWLVVEPSGVAVQ